MRFYLVTYRPLCDRAAGIQAAQRHGHPWFVDASCRREPDFEARRPSISALCRGAMFAPRLRVGDVVVHVTKKGRYLGNADPAWRLVSVMQVARTFRDHSEAAAWYQVRGLALPSNCLVVGNPPLDLKHTASPTRDLDAWDDHYRERVIENPIFHIGESLFRELIDPPVLTPQHMLDALGTDRLPRTPTSWPRCGIEGLLRMVGVEIAPLSLNELRQRTEDAGSLAFRPAPLMPRSRSHDACDARASGSCYPSRPSTASQDRDCRTAASPRSFERGRGALVRCISPLTPTPKNRWFRAL